MSASGYVVEAAAKAETIARANRGIPFIDLRDEIEADAARRRRVIEDAIPAGATYEQALERAVFHFKDLRKRSGRSGTEDMLALDDFCARLCNREGKPNRVAGDALSHDAFWAVILP